MSYIEELCKSSKAASVYAATMKTEQKNEILETIADEIYKRADEITRANIKDITAARQNGMSDSFIDRLTITEERINGMIDGITQVINLPDPIGEVIGGRELPNGLKTVKRRVPLGVIGIIFESRPNVAVDAAVLCLKSGNCCILRGGSDAFRTNKCLADIMRGAVEDCCGDPNIILLVEDTSREAASEFMKMRGYVDVLIPRGGKGLINSVSENAKIPVIETGAGVCHVYVDRFADIDTAVNIVDNAKTQRPSVCNSAETVLVHDSIASEVLKRLSERWNGNVKFYGDEASGEYLKLERIASEEDYGTEWNDYIICVKIVSCVDEAISHINRYGTKHSESIVTINLNIAEKFQNEVDAAAVYVNASTRFTDGFEFGLGAEIGITTQKLHARGPLGLTELTTYKYLINGSGQIRQ